jgi:tetratricopeptide (TPR) repeat protein
LSHDDSNFKIYLHLAWNYFLQGQINQALEFVRRADRKNKGTQSDSFYINGRCYMALQNNKEALENF